jgi:hypothetical protein
MLNLNIFMVGVWVLLKFASISPLRPFISFWEFAEKHAGQ